MLEEFIFLYSILGIILEVLCAIQIKASQKEVETMLQEQRYAPLAIKRIFIFLFLSGIKESLKAIWIKLFLFLCYIHIENIMQVM